ncbi:MAG TPA: RNA polymerase sigma factor [Acidobacteriaceae bacterium]|jgi:RNA polymerase sigma-70 factor, ECF subfamily|nr:RNA polymerase sigma factor [Acidobacteriaceae bacterium]
MSGAGTITWGVRPWNLGMMGFPAVRPAERELARGAETAPGQRRTAGGADGKPGERWQKKELTGPRTGERVLDRSGQHSLEKPVEAEWQVLVERCLKGDSFAWTELVKAHHRRVYGLCYRFTGSAADAEDLTQEVFLKVYGNLAAFDLARGTFQTWITTMTRNLLVDHFRRSRAQRVTDSIDAGWDGDGDEMPLVQRLAESGPTQHDQAVKKEIEKMVQEALTKISPELREAVILRDLQDLDYKEIAQVLHIPEGTVKSRISRGRAELARLLERNKGQVV